MRAGVAISGEGQTSRSNEGAYTGGQQPSVISESYLKTRESTSHNNFKGEKLTCVEEPQVHKWGKFCRKLFELLSWVKLICLLSLCLATLLCCHMKVVGHVMPREKRCGALDMHTITMG